LVVVPPVRTCPESDENSVKAVGVKLLARTVSENVSVITPVFIFNSNRRNDGEAPSAVKMLTWSPERALTALRFMSTIAELEIEIQVLSLDEANTLSRVSSLKSTSERSTTITTPLILLVTLELVSAYDTMEFASLVRVS